MAFIPILSPEAHLEGAEDVARVHGFKLEAPQRQLASTDLRMRMRSAHYPQVFLFEKGRLSDLPIVGVMPEKTLASYIDLQIATFKKQGKK